MPRRHFAQARALRVRTRSALALFVSVGLMCGVALPILGATSAGAAGETLSVNNVSRQEGNLGSAPATFTVTLSAAAAGTVTVDYTTVNGTATAGADYTATSGTVTFLSGQTTRTVNVQVTGDTLDEADETFTLVLSNPTGATISDGEGVATINDDDGAPRLSIDNGIPNPLLEDGGGTATFTVSLSAPSGQSVTVDYATSNGTATAGADYTAASGTLTFDPGQTSRTVTVTILDDTADEDNETFKVDLTNPVNATISDPQGLATIVDDDGPPALSIADDTQVEGDAGTSNASFTVTLAPASGKSVTVNYSTANGTATQPADYTATAGTLSFAAGETTKTILVPVKGDTLDEAHEFFTVNLSLAANATVADASATGTITDDDAGPELSIGDRSLSEGTAGPTAFAFTVTLAPTSAQIVTVDYTTVDGAATAPGDYVAQAGTLVFAPGDTSKTITVLVNGDLAGELAESFFVDLSDPTNATVADGRGEGTILNDDGPPSSLSVDDVVVTEGNTGTTNASFTVTLSPAATQTVTVAYATADGTASAITDYQTRSGTLVFAAGETSKTVTVPVVGDTLDEVDETFVLNLSTALNAQIADAQGQATITDDDAAPNMSIDDDVVTEGDTGTATATFTVTLSTASGRTVTVDYATADDTAAAGSDYTAATGTLTFAAGVTTRTVSVPVLGDSMDENDETFRVNLSNAVNATVTDSQGAGVITDDDGPPSLSVSDVSVTEGDAGSTPAQFTVSLSAASGRTVTVAYATADGTATTADSDYTAASGTLTFAAGETSKTVTVNVTGDVSDEPNEAFTLNLSSPTNVTLADASGTATIADDDGPPSLSVEDVSVTEPDTGSVTAAVKVQLLPASGLAVTVDFTTANGTANAGSDYTTTSGTLSFAAGETEKLVNVPVTGDAVDEADETFTVTLSNPANAVVGDAAGTVTILDNDAAPSLTIDDVTVPEGSSGTTNAVLTVTLAAASGQQVTVDYATANGTATAGTDYTAATGTVTFAPGETTKQVTVVLAGDTLDEADETLTVGLSNATNATVGDASGTVTITDDDANPSLSVADATVAEGNSGTTNAVLTVTLAPASGQSVTVNYATANGTATAGSDYTAAAGTLTFAPGETTKAVNVVVAGDTVDEADETFTLTLAGATNATIGDASATVTITDDDPLPSLTIDDVSVTEGASGTRNATFTVTSSAASGRAVTVAWATANGTATAPADYTAANGTVTIPAGQRTATIAVSVAGDTLPEGNQTFNVVLSSPTNATLGDATGVGTIVDDDEPTPVPTPTGDGYWMVASDGGIFAFGGARFFGSTGTLALNQPIVAMAPTPSGNGYWLVASDGGIFNFGDAAFFGSTGALRLNSPIVGMTPTPTGRGYWLVAADGGIFNFGDARFFGSTGAIRLNKPVVGMAATPSGAGYWLVATDGGIFNFGDAAFFGSTGAIRLNSPIVGMTPTATGRGYWLVAADGGIFNFGDARFFGSTGAIRLNQPVVGMSASPTGNGYWLVASDGGVFNFGAAAFFGSTGALRLARPVVGIAVHRS